MKIIEDVVEILLKPHNIGPQPLMIGIIHRLTKQLKAGNNFIPLIVLPISLQ